MNSMAELLFWTFRLNVVSELVTLMAVGNAQYVDFSSAANYFMNHFA